MIDDFIQNELNFFKPMSERQHLATIEMRERWKSETLIERQERVSLETYDLCKGIVKYGLFEGLKLTPDPRWGKLDLGSQCLGLYEREILQYLSLIIAGKYKTFIDIGAADGYYSTGMLFTGLVEKAICFEISEAGQKLIELNWLENGNPGILEVFGEANAFTLMDLPSENFSKALILIDIEGYEFDLLTLDLIERLKASDVIIEIHNWVEDFESKYRKLLKNLSRYFKIEVMERLERPTANITELRSYTDDNRLLLTSERRPCLMRFLKLVPLIA